MRNLSIVYYVSRVLVFALMTKTQFDEKRYIMPELRRYDLLTLEMIDRESHIQDIIEQIINNMPRLTAANQDIMIASLKQQSDQQILSQAQPKAIAGTECVICLEYCISQDNQNEKRTILIMQCGSKSAM